MSSLLCGQLTFSRDLSQREAAELGFSLARVALDERLGLQIGCAVVQPIVLQMVGADRALEGAKLPFLLTDSPVSDVSERIIDKYAPEYPEEEPDGPLEARLNRVAHFVTKAMAIPEVVRMTLVFADG